MSNRLSFIGDLVCDNPWLNAMDKKNNCRDFSSCFKYMTDEFHKSTYVIGNLETVFAGKDKGYNSKPYHYNSPDALLDAIKDSGINVLSCANNHCMDYGIEGITQTLCKLDNYNLLHTGTFICDNEKKYLVINIGNKKVGIFSCTYGVNDTHNVKDLHNHVNLLQPSNIDLNNNKGILKIIVNKMLPTALKGNILKIIKRILKKPTINSRIDNVDISLIDQNFLIDIRNTLIEMKSETDLSIVCVHIGGQFNEYPGNYTRYIFDYLKNIGINVIIGNHPHVIQKCNISDNCFFAYSCGGFNLSPSADYINHSFDPDYSLMINLYISDNEKIKISFSILKIEEYSNGDIQVLPIKLYFNGLSESEKENFASKIKELYNRITGKNEESIEIKDEYYIGEIL